MDTVWYDKHVELCSLVIDYAMTLQAMQTQSCTTCRCDTYLSSSDQASVPHKPSQRSLALPLTLVWAHCCRFCSENRQQTITVPFWPAALLLSAQNQAAPGASLLAVSWPLCPRLFSCGIATQLGEVSRPRDQELIKSVLCFLWRLCWV